VTPSDSEIRSGLVDVWLGLRLYITPTRFRAALSGNEKALLAQQWGTLRAIWEEYERTALSESHAKECRTKSRRWAALEAWARDSMTTFPASLKAFDPTRGNTLSWEEFAAKDGVPPDDPDYPWGRWLDPAVLELFGNEALNSKLRAAGWQLGESVRADDREIARLRGQGLGTHEIASRLGLDHWSVVAVLSTPRPPVKVAAARGGG
jgi:hypothetical protein